MLLAVSTEATTTYLNFFRIRIEVQGIYSDDGQEVNKYYIYMDLRTSDLDILQKLMFFDLRWGQSPKMQLIYLDFGHTISA